MNIINNSLLVYEMRMEFTGKGLEKIHLLCNVLRACKNHARYDYSLIMQDFLY